MAVITGTAFCDKNTWYSSNNAAYAPSNINDGVAGSRWIGAAVDATASLQNFCGVKFTGLKDITEVTVSIASWGRNFSIGTWNPAKDPASATFTKADIIPLSAIDVVATPNDANSVAIGINKTLRFVVAATGVPGILFYCDNNATSVLTNTAGGANTNQSLNEVGIVGADSTGNDGWVKQPGTANASSQYNDFGTPASVTDGNVGTGWSSGGVGAGATADWIMLQFPSPIKPRKVEFYFYSWGKTIALGYANTNPSAKTDFTVVRLVDVTVTPNDDLGVPWGRGKINTLLLPETTPLGVYWGTYTNDYTASIMGLSNGSLDRARLMEFNIYAKIQNASDGINPKPPAVVPVAPFSVAPTNWVRTEFNTAGDFDFTPAADTTLVMAIVQGAGSGGQLLKNLNGSDTTFTTVNEGADSWIATPAGDIMSRAGGGKGITAGAFQHLISTTPTDWVRFVDANGAVGLANVNPQQAALVGAAQTLLSGVPGATYSLAGMTGPNLSYVDFALASSESLLVPDTQNLFIRDNALGWLSQNVGGSSTGFVQFQPIQLVVGQTAKFTFNTSSEATDMLRIWINGVNVFARGGVLVDFQYTFTATVAGNHVIRFEYTKDATVDGGENRVYVKRMEVSNAQYPLQRSGASGSNSITYLTPNPMKIRVGAAGVGVAGGQTVPAGAKGTRGAGGAAGADGGGGVVVIYEFKSSILFEKPVEPITLPQVNVLTEVTGFYRTEYAPRGFAVDGLQSAFTHKLRPRTKSVIALIVGAGGNGWNGFTSTQKAGDTTISTTAKSYTAGGAYSAYKVVGQSDGQPGNGGVFVGDTEPVLSKDGARGGTVGGSTANPSGIVSAYGNGTTSSYLGTAGGGAGAYAIVIYQKDSFNADRTLNLSIGNTIVGGSVGGSGAVFIYETESEFGPYVTQLTEMVLQKAPQGFTAVTQTAEMVLQKSAVSDRRVTQVAELILVKDSDEVDLQVSNAYAALVFDAAEVAINVTQAAELVLQKSAKAATTVTQTAEMVLQKTGRSPYRATQVAQLFLVAETPTVFWLNFGILENPMRFQLYDSAIGRASSVPPNCKIQIEGFFAPGTQMFINGVASGVLADVKNNDRVYLHGGVTNYWQTNIPVYAYYEQNGETARMLVGNWIIKQPELTPLITKAYYGSKVTPTWIKSRAGVGSPVTLQSIITKALMSLVQLTMTAVQNKFGSLVNLLQEKTVANSRIAEVTIGWDVTKALSKVSDPTSWIYTQALSIDVKNVVTWGTLKAQVSEYKQADFIAPQAKYGDVETDYEVRADGSTGYVTFDSEQYVLSVNYSHFTLDTAQTQAGYGDYVVKDVDKLNVGYGDVDQEYEYNNVDHSVTYEVVYVAVQSSSVARLFPMEPMGTIAYSVLTGMEWERSTAQGTGDWVIPTFSALNPQAKYGMFGAAGVDSNSGHSEYSQRETEVINGPQQGYFGTTSLWVQTYSVYAEREATVKRSEKTVAFDVTPIKTTAKTGVFNLTPFLAMQSVNGIGKASLYKGFDTKAEVDQFTENFSGVHTALKYNGYVYTLDVDKSFICEIFNNGPVKWLLQGG